SIDTAILNFAESKNIAIKDRPERLFETPFNYENRFMSIAVKIGDKKILICKGSPEAIITRLDADEAGKKKIEKMAADLQKRGLRVIAVASKEIKNFDPKLVKSEFKQLKFGGFINFADVPKRDMAEDFKKFENLGVSIKIVTGDSEFVAEKISRDVAFDYKKVLINSEIEKMSDSQLEKKVWETDIFARITPSQKTRIIQALKKGNHTIGFLGDGVNDGPALHMADVGISVNTGVDVAKDAASVVLLRKNLGVIADGIKEGRVTFQNTIKYILMGTSSSFGNMVSAAAASIILPFLPMTPVQLLLNDIMYDISQTSIPTDHVDADQILRPKSWDISYIKSFMILFGLIGTLYDFLTFAVMYFIFHARGSLFQTGWFVTSFITEVLVVFVIRTRKIPFWKSKPSLPFLITCLCVVAIGLYLPFSPFASYLDFTPLPMLYFGFLIGITLTYLVMVEIGKSYLNKERFN
ncbi:MAG: HAD-IC family P-type ATPase, partial [Candidatus Woesebacteria bacterium]|nr:HAD-IC family P-type ATPase [Candidatus Woesebacteria bacterium]